MKPKVLIVDDEPLMHLLYRRPLHQAGYELVSARNAVEAVAAVATEVPRIIIMDIMMPGGDGLSVLRQLKKSESTREIPVVIVTACLEHYMTAISESERSGAACFLSKPLSPARLVQEVKRLAPVEMPSQC